MVSWYDSEFKQEFKKWINKGVKPLRKLKVQRVTAKLIATKLWEGAGILLVVDL
jgi:hypothetical protein